MSKPILDDYAYTIQCVFEKLRVLFQEGASSGDWDNVAGDVLVLLKDEEKLEEIIQVAKETVHR